MGAAGLSFDPLTLRDLDAVCALEYQTNANLALGRGTLRRALVAADCSPLADRQGLPIIWAAWGCFRGAPNATDPTAWILYTIRGGILHLERLTLHPATLHPDSTEAAILEWLTTDLAGQHTPITLWQSPDAQPWTPHRDTLAGFGFYKAAASPTAWGHRRPGYLWARPCAGHSLESLASAAGGRPGNY